MKTILTSRCALAALTAIGCLAWSPSTLFAQLNPGESDRLWETITNHHGATVNSPVSFSVPEDAAEPSTITVTIPALTIDFVSPTESLSDRFHFDAFNVHITSDGDATPLFLRTGTTIVPPSFLETFTPVTFFAHSDGDNNLTNTGSDHFVIKVWGPTGLATFLDVIMAEAGFPEGPDSPTIVPFTIDAHGYDVIGGDPGETSGSSDWVDIDTVTGYFVSSDNPNDYPPLSGEPVHGIVVEDGLPTDPTYGGDMNYSLTFQSDVVPEPCSIALLSCGGILLAALGWKRP